MKSRLNICRKNTMSMAGVMLAWSIIIGTLFLVQIACRDSRVGDKEADSLNVRPAQARVLMAITPGKPSASTESIKLMKQGSIYTIRLRRVDTYGKLLKEEEIELGRADFVSVWTIVEREGLTSFNPEEVKAQVADFGKHRFRVEFMSKEGAELKVHEVAWTQPLNNEASIASLISQLGQLAQKYAKKTQLFYFPVE